MKFNIEKQDTSNKKNITDDTPDYDSLMKMTLEERLPFLQLKLEKDFIAYYGDIGLRLVNALKKVNDQSLVISVPRYAMHIPDEAYQTPKEVLESRAKNLFEKSVFILETIQEIESFLENKNLDGETLTKISSYKDNLFTRALQILHKRFLVNQQQNEGTLWYLAQTKSIEKDLEISDEELFLSLYWFKFAKSKTPPPSIEDVLSHKFYINKSSSLEEKYKNQISDIYKDNWKEEKKETQEALLKNLYKSFNDKNNNSEFVIIENAKEVVGFIKYEDFGEYQFASSLNIKKDYQKFGLADSLLDASLKSKSVIKPVHARARLSLDYIRKYIEDLNAFGTSVEDYHNTPHLNLIFSAEQKNNFITSNLELDEINNLNNLNILIKKIKNTSEITSVKDFYLTRLIKKDDFIYCVYEKSNNVKS